MYPPIKRCLTKIAYIADLKHLLGHIIQWTFTRPNE